MKALNVLTTNHERAEWSRMAKAAYASGHNATGHRFSVAATQLSMPLARFDSLQADYRSWLIDNQYPETAPV